MLLAHLELASYLSPYGPEPPTEDLLAQMLALPPSDRAELAEILGAMALKVEKRGRKRRGIGWPAGDEP